MDELNPGDVRIEISTKAWPIPLVVISVIVEGKRASFTYPPSEARRMAADLIAAAEAVENADSLK